MREEHRDVRFAELVVPCVELAETLELFTGRLGFRVEAVVPADDPVAVVVSGHGVRLRLDRAATGEPGVLRLPRSALSDPLSEAAAGGEILAPNGMRIELVDLEPTVEVPRARTTFELTRFDDGAAWKVGRAGMRYRDLIPSRQGGRFVASHIRIEEGGPVPDYVHFHRVRFQMIYCLRGWVRVVYESQGPEFVLVAGDCVLQPPAIRHRVLESSPGLEVIEVSCPAAHETLADHELELPSRTIDPERRFDGQRFLRHEVATASWAQGRADGFEARDLGIDAATGGVASAVVARAGGVERTPTGTHAVDFRLVVLLEGSAVLETEERGAERLGAGDAIVLPGGLEHALNDCSRDLELLEVSIA